MQTGYKLIRSLALALIASTSDGLRGGEFQRGDVDGDGAVTITDPLLLLGHLFQGGALGCDDAADVDDDGALALPDAVLALQSLFLDGSALPEPAGACGADPTSDGLGCREGGACGAGGDSIILALHAECQPGPCNCGIEDAVFQSADGGCKEIASGLVWTMGPPGGWDWASTQTVLTTFTSGGFSDWRLPTVAELQHLAADGNYTHLQLFQDHPDSGWGYWSSQEKGTRAWRVILGGPSNGSTGLTLKISYMALLFVRQGTLPPGVCGNGICEPGESCTTCADCPGKSNGPASGKYCCGNGVTEAPEAADPGLCDGNS